ncbi:MAG: oxidoreductase [Azospira oryzae]|jgi:predicted oxidoreductase|nr:MAG: oxidoreductase [Azospira oryzae]
MSQQRQLHPQGPVFSRIIAGAWRWNTVSADTLERLIKTALDHGINTFDHADIYGDYSNEALFGDMLKKNPSLLKSMKLVSKCGIKLLSQKKPEHRVKHYDTSRAHIIASTETSLQRLGTDHLDLLLIHRPDPLMDAAEVRDAFIQLKQQGKVLHFGVSNFTPAQFDLLQSHLPFPLVTNQIEISLFNNQSLFDGSIDHLYQLKTSAMAWSPLGGGKQMQGEVIQNLNHLKRKYTATESQLLYAWLLKHPSVIFPVIGTTQPERIVESVKALDISLDRQDWFEMLKWATGKEVA